jgi:3',5'-cyclic AMP phosphodiesterase CpdA
MNKHNPPRPKQLSRRDMLRGLSAGALLGLGLWPGCASVSAERKTAATKLFQFIEVNDTHYMSPECGEWLQKVVKKMATHKEAEFCLHLGDVTDKAEREHFAAVRDIFKGLQLPFYGQIGNHDYAAQKDRKSYEEIFPKRLNYWFEHRGWQFLGLDTTQGTDYQNTVIGDATLGWVDDSLPKLEKAKPTVLFTHFPLGEGVTYRPANADALLNRFRDFNLQAAFSGHFHGYTERTLLKAILTTNKCCALKRGNHDNTKEKGYFLCTASASGVKREFVEVS